MSEEKPIPSSYAEAGIDLSEEAKVLSSINQYVKKSFAFGNVIAAEGHYANLIKLGDHGIALATDGVGTKLLIAQQIKKFDTIGIDCVAMNVNDLLAMGIIPKAFVDYLAVSELNVELAEEIMKGLYKGCELASIPILGGELATIPELLAEKENSFDVAGTALGIVHLSKIIDGTKVKTGDSILGISSNGIHSNGFTLARKVLLQKYKLTDVIPGGGKLYEELLKPTRIYVKAISELLDSCDVHGLAHITGGGFKKLFRLTNLGFEFKHFPNPPLIFSEIQQIGRIDYREMFTTFNMGIGFMVIVSEESEQNALSLLNKHFESYPLGTIIDEPIVKINDYNVTIERSI